MTDYPKHDQIFRKALENPIVAKEFFDTHLPENIKKLFSPETLKMEKDSFVEKDLKDSISDVLFSVEFKSSNSRNATNNDTKHKDNNINYDNTGYLWLLLEHQSTPDYFMAFRLFKYMLNIADRHLTLHPKSRKLPFVYPIIFYNGTKKYTSPLNIWQLFKHSELAKTTWVNDYQLINVHDIPDEELKKKAWSGILLFFMKHIKERNLLKRWHEVADLLPKFTEFTELNIGYNYIELILHYTLTKIEQNDKIELEQMLRTHLNPKTGEKLMTSLAHHWEQQGITQGMQIGKQEGIQIGEARGEARGEAKALMSLAKKMLTRKKPLEEIIEFTGLTKEQLNNLL